MCGRHVRVADAGCDRPARNLTGPGGRIAPYPARVVHERFRIGSPRADQAGPGTPTAERRCSNHRQCGFESHPGYHKIIAYTIPILGNPW
ncbi:hypothetical protein FMEAI12_4260006 [Parafrankia sp. Ea1.12]|nr:hypothetical protein FMEAI12_4260006 [Parafrankia sp. Ea1.12]